MAPLIPRMDVFEFADFDWFPSFLRAYVQAGLTAAWTTKIPLLQTSSPAQVVARLLRTHLAHTLPSYVFIDFCAGGGGPTPSIERHLNTTPPSPSPKAKDDANNDHEPIQFVLTDLHPHTDLWSQAALQSRHLSYIPTPVDASRAPRELISRYHGQGKKVFRLFNLAFHHFGDGLARRMLRDTVEEGGGDGIGIFELQDRGVAGFLSCCLFGVGVFVMAPWYAFLWGAPMALVFTYLLPVLPFVLVFDGWMSCLRTRTPEEVEVLLRTCGAAEGEIARWEVKSGSEMFMWPVGRVNWVVCVKRD